MLAISRKQNESIVVTCPDSSELTIRVAEIRTDKVKLEFIAPFEMSIHRQEVHDAICGKTTEKKPPSVISQLRSELEQSKKDVELYRSMLSVMATDAWKDVTREQLENDAVEARSIDDIISDLEKASAA